MRWLSILFITMLSPFVALAQNNYVPWAVYYDDKASIEDLKQYKLLVLDSKYHPPLRPLLDSGVTLLGYISLGEVEKYRSYFKEAKKQDILLKENKFWPGSYFVDMRKNWWPEYVITKAIPAILRKGFNGIFLDTLDNPIALEREDKQAYEGMKQAAINLVKAIRHHYPNIKIMINRGYEIWPYVAGDVDMVLGESMYADHNFDTGRTNLVSEYEYKEQLRWLNNAKEQNPKLGVYTLDYWNKHDKEGIKHIYEVQRKNGFIPYVATVKLNELIAEPGAP